MGRVIPRERKTGESCTWPSLGESMEGIERIKERWRGQLIVSCQAAEGEPLHGPIHMAALARAAGMGGAAGVRADGPQDVEAIRQVTDLPIVASFKMSVPGSEVRVTPTFDAARQVVAAGADVVGMDATARARPGDDDAAALIRRIQRELGAGVMADASTLEEAIAAAEAGADFVTTALAGYTAYTSHVTSFSFELLDAMVERLDAPVVAEGWVQTPDEAAEAIARGAFAVVVGTAITRPQRITERFAQALKGVG